MSRCVIALREPTPPLPVHDDGTARSGVDGDLRAHNIMTSHSRMRWRSWVGGAVAICAAICVSARTSSAQSEEEGIDAGTPRVQLILPAPSRPAVLLPLYIGNAGLQAYDGYSTLEGTRSGLRELNPLIGSLAAQPAALWAVKAASTATAIVVAERLWRGHRRKQAIALMLITDGVMAAVAVRNAAILDGGR